jgi:hypothetical protein
MLGSSQSKIRFIHEARAAAALDHANICTIYEINEVQNQTFIAMAYIEGKTLKHKISAGALPLDQALDIGIQVAAGLQHAHAKGIVHRDIKPSNVMITPQGQAKIMDFGLARSVGQSEITRTGVLMGTACYMSPEQASGQRVDHRTDIWSFGVMFHEMLTGRSPFLREHDQAIIYAILNTAPEPLREARKDVPEGVEPILSRALAKRPAERYQSADELLQDLRALRGVTAGSPLPMPLSRAPGSVPRDPRPSVGSEAPATLSSQSRFRLRRWRMAIVWGGAGILALLIFIVVRPALVRSPPLDPMRVAVAVFENRSGDQSLTSLGLAVADWVAQGADELGIGDVVPMATVTPSSRVVASGSGGAQDGRALQRLARETEAGSVVSGAYTLLADSLQFWATVTDATDGTVLFTLASPRVARADPTRGLEEWRDRIMGGLAWHLDPWGQYPPDQRPPLLDAMREMQLAGEVPGGHRGEARTHLQRAVAIDSTVLVDCCLSLIEICDQAGNHRSADSLLQVLDARRPELTLYERAEVDYMSAVLGHNHQESYRRLKELHAMVPKDQEIIQDLGVVAMRINRPGEAVQWFKMIDVTEYPHSASVLDSWRYLNMLRAVHMTEDYEYELRLAQRARKRFPESVEFVAHEARAHAALGDTRAVNKLVEESFSMPQTKGTAGGVMSEAANELRAHGQVEAGLEMLERYIARLVEQNGSDCRPARAYLHLCRGEFAEADTLYGRCQHF